MAELLSINNISLLLVFVVPGFVALSIRSQFMVGTSVPDNREQFLSYVTISVIYGTLVLVFLMLLSSQVPIGPFSE